MDLTIYQYGYERCEPLKSFGPYVRNNYLFHYVISGKGTLNANDEKDHTSHYHLSAGSGFLIEPGYVNTYYADEAEPRAQGEGMYGISRAVVQGPDFYDDGAGIRGFD